MARTPNVRVVVVQPRWPRPTKQDEANALRKAITRFNKICGKEGILTKASAMTEYESPSERRARKAKRAKQLRERGIL